MMGEGLKAFMVGVKESDLWIAVGNGDYSPDLERWAFEALTKIRAELEEWIALDSEFERSLTPIRVPVSAPAIVKAMADAAAMANVGPMAAVAGAIAEEIGEKLRADGIGEIIIENGGDIYMVTGRSRRITVYAGETSPWSYRTALLIRPEDTPCGIATSSGSLGHSLSFGSADAVSVIARSATVADAFATAIGNLVSTPSDIEPALRFTKRHIGGDSGIRGSVVMVGDKMGACGDLHLVPIK